MACALSIAGSDPSGGAGLQADLKTFQQHQVHGAAVVSLLTVQNTRGVARVEALDAALVGEQLRAVLDDLRLGAIKTGALGSLAIVEEVARQLAKVRCPIVVDPVLISSSGRRLLDEGAQRALVERLFPLATLVTPNAQEASVLTGVTVDSVETAARAAKALVAGGARAVLVKGGHVPGRAVDVLATERGVIELDAPRLDVGDVHGTGCALSASIAARLALGDSLEVAVRGAKAWLGRALETAVRSGSGQPSVNHLTPVEAR